jgi:S1-C subfamily serine protease
MMWRASERPTENLRFAVTDTRKRIRCVSGAPSASLLEVRNMRRSLTTARSLKIVFCILGLSLNSMQSLAQVPMNVVGRVLQIQFNNMTGTGFIVDYESGQYIVTANHLMITASDKAAVQIHYSDSEWHSLDVTVLHGPNECIDVAVLILAANKLTTADPVSALDDQFLFGQEAYFLGYPYGLYTSFRGQKVVVPVVKHGYISASVPCSAIPLVGAAADRLILMDGMNNQGFSGGPVVAPDLNMPGHPFKFVGVIKAYRNADFSNTQIAGNSGISLVVPIERAIDLIRQYKDKEAKAK